LPNVIPRILTKAYIDTKEFGLITFYNTHLSVKNDKVKKKQLNSILDNIKKETNPVILTGDFNMTINNPLFKEFINELEKIGIKRVNVLEKTYKTHSKNNAIDHIFVSKKMNILKYKVIKDDKYKDFSDHYPIIVFLNRVK
jgi:endonuclease/exonuclease/phosphatase family metal-dependent hydrolase